MKTFRTWALASTAAAALAACGGGGDGNQTPQVTYTQVVTFGDSLSDVGSYQVSTIAAVGGGLYTVNGASATPNWTQRIALSVGQPAGCAAETGLNSVIPTIPAVPVTEHAGCYNYAQGGARVTDPIGVGNIAVWTEGGDPSGQLGQLTVPIVTQMQNHLAKIGGKFSGGELVTVLGGGNDVFFNLSQLQETIAAGGDPTAAQTAAVQAMGLAGAQLAGYIQSLLVANGATHVVVVNLPDVSETPLADEADAATPGTRELISTMTTTFNQQLAAGLSGVSGVLQVDAYTQGRAQYASPAQYGITNVTDTACDLTLLGQILFASSLVCSSVGNASIGIPPTVISGDISHYQFADTVHPTPYGYQLLAQYVTQVMTQAGWL